MARSAPRSTFPGPTSPDRGLNRFLLLYALANAGGVVAYLPLLTMLLPLKIEGVAPAERIGVLTLTVLAGAISASLANIAFGWASDRSVARGGDRRKWIAGGLVATAAGYVAIFAAATPVAIVVSVIAWQVALNMALAPLMAMMADAVPDGRKGVAGGLLALANPLASLASALLVAAAMLGEGARYAIVCLLFTAMIAPVLAVRAPVAGVSAPPVRPSVARADLAIAGVARLLVQVAGTVLFGYLLFYFESIAPGAASADLAPRVGHILTLAFALPLPVALIAGRASDRVGRRKPFLIGAAALAASGLAAMAVAPGWTVAVAGFFAYACGSAVFLGLHSALAMQMLPSPEHRGRDLGLLNLTNTLPSVIGPGLTWLLATREDFGGVLGVLAVLTLAGGLATLAIRGQR